MRILENKKLLRHLIPHHFHQYFGLFDVLGGHDDFLTIIHKHLYQNA